MGGMGIFLAGLENLTFVERIAERFTLEKATVVRRLGIAAGVLLVVLASAVFLSSTSEGEISELAEPDAASANLEPAATSFDGQSEQEMNDTAASAVASTVVVYVTGGVVEPGVYTLDSHKRISDAIEAAGGLLPEAARAVVNFALPLSDGMHIHIPLVSEVALDAPEEGALGSVVQNSGQPVSESNTESALININTADSALLQTLEGIGPATAQKIIDYRTAHGRFQSKEELMNVSGIGEKKYAAIEHRITV